MSDLEQIWLRASEYLKGQVLPDLYKRWLSPLVPVRIEETKFVLGVANAMWTMWLERSMKDVIEESLFIATGINYEVAFEVQNSAENKAAAVVESGAPIVSIRRKLKSVPAEKAVKPEAPAESRPQLAVESSLKSLDRRFTFSEFVVGDCNRMAYAVSNAVAEQPGSQYNPYFIYSGTGMGKTHLLQSIAQEVLKRTPTAQVMYVTSEDMLNQYVEAVSHNQSMAFRKRYRNLDVLLIDDVQFLGTTQKFQEEFFHTFNALYNAHKQIVMSSDKPPQEINGLEKRLVSRFECGFTAEIQSPDVETRIAIIRKKQENQNYKLDDRVIRYVAEHISSSIRRLESSVFKLVSWASLSGVKIDVKSAERILEDVLIEEGGSAVTVEEIQKIVAEQYDLRVSDLVGTRRPASIAFPRQIAMYFCRKMTRQSVASVGEKFCRNHATVLHAVQQIEEKMEASEEFRLEMQQLEHRICKA